MCQGQPIVRCSNSQPFTLNLFKTGIFCLLWFSVSIFQEAVAQTDTTKSTKYIPSFKPNFKFSDRITDPFSSPDSKSPFFLGYPSNYKTNVEIDSTSGGFEINEKLGDVDYRNPNQMTFEQYEKYKESKMQKDYMKEKSEAKDAENPAANRSLIPKIFISPMFDRIFGGNFVDIRPAGSVMLDFGGQWQRVANPGLPIRMQRSGNFNFDQQIAVNVQGKIGEKLKISINHDTKANFDFDNNIRLNYSGFDTEILQKIEAGNVSLPLSSRLITGNQNLFGFKTTMKFGRLQVTSVVSNQRGKANNLKLQGGAQTKNFMIPCDRYQANQHFFLGQFFRLRYADVLRSLPVVTSGVTINRVEVYITNRSRNPTQMRNIAAFLDLGEPAPFRTTLFSKPGQRANNPTTNANNTLYDDLLTLGQNLFNSNNTSQTLEAFKNRQLQKSTDYEFLRGARKLEPDRDFTINRQLGYISLNTPLRDDEIMGVAYEYSFNGRIFKVGELQEDYSGRNADNTIVLKLLRPSTIQTNLPTWDLQMKNVYSLEASQLSRENFQLRIIYRDDSSGVDNPSLPAGVNLKNRNLLQVFNMDRLNPMNELQPDGNFDFVEGVTIDSRAGRVFFPVTEPFGSFLNSRFVLPAEQNLADKYVFGELYQLTQADALQAANKAKFFLVGRYQSSSSSVIQLPGINIAQGSVIVTAGARNLTEGSDYQVDYDIGRVTILNEGLLQSNEEINVRYEQADLFQFQQRSLFGSRWDYTVNKDFVIGGTLLYMNERPVIRRVNVGDEPAKNTMIGLDVSYRKDSRVLTKLVDALPLISTKEVSNVTLSAEYARLIPGTSRFVDRSGGGISYIDDFEGIRTQYDFTRQANRWKISSTPVGFEGPGFQTNPLRYNDRRSKFSWYNIDPSFYVASGPLKPQNITNKDLENHYIRPIGPQEVFPNRDLGAVNLNEITLDMAYYPNLKGQYNYNPQMQSNGSPVNPERNWGGMVRAITTDTDFDQANIEYLEFWMMDPFIAGENGKIESDPQEYIPGRRQGRLVFDLGSISEDVMRDGRHSYEQGLPTTANPTATTISPFGRIPANSPPLVNAFANTAGSRATQDVGLDGMNDADEQQQFAEYLSALPGNLDPNVRQQIENDPSNDNFSYFLGPDKDAGNLKILERYKSFNSLENNSPEATAQGGLAISPSYSQEPDNEDINTDNTINELNAYFSYKIDVEPGKLIPGQNYCVNVLQSDKGVNWYLFRIPIRDLNHPNFNGAVGNINNFKTLRFLRAYMTGFTDPVVLRFVQMQMVGSQWRPYPKSLSPEGALIDDEDNSSLTIATANIEENGAGGPNQVPYTIPPGALPRDRDLASGVNRRLNEQSLSLCLDRLPNGTAKAVFKNIRVDFLNYQRLKMFVHAQSIDIEGTRSKDLEIFIRLGTDFTENYYELSKPLILTPLGQSSYSPAEVWPDANQIDLAFKDLFETKLERNFRRFPFFTPYKKAFGDDNTITIMGNPDLNSVMTVMIGIRNPDLPDDNNADKTVCVWLNELRVTDFIKNAGWAATGTMAVKLADLAIVNFSGKVVTPGFGGIEQKISERARETTRIMNVASNVTLDKFLPKELGLKVPMYVSYETNIITPQYDPLNPDVPVKLLIDKTPSGGRRDTLERYLKLIEDRNTKRSINFTNIQKVKTGQNSKSRIYDVENLNFTYAYSEINRSNINIEDYTSKNYQVGIGYNYNSSAKPLEPFKKIKLFDSPYLKLIKEFNVSFLPSSVTARADFNRVFARQQLRGNDVFAPSDTSLRFYEKAFSFNRNYGLRYAPFKSLTIDYQANVAAIIDEPTGEIDNTPVRAGSTKTKRDSVRENLRNLGRMKNFSQNIRAGYKVPLDKFPAVNWIGADVAYAAGYQWTATPLGLNDTVTEINPTGNFLGNTLQNNREQAINGRIDFVKLYNKVKFLEKVNNYTPKPKPKKKEEDKKNPKKKPVEKPQLGKDGKPIKDSTKTKKPPPEFKALKFIARTLMSVRNINFSVTQTDNTLLPGYMPTVDYFGLNKSSQAPGLPFVLGVQDPNIRFRAAENGWLSQSPDQNTQFTQARTVNITARATIEPVRDFRIQLDVKRNESDSYNELFRPQLDSATGRYLRSDETGKINYFSQTPSRSGNYSVSFISIGSAFGMNNKSPQQDNNFEQFKQNRAIIEQRLRQENPNAITDSAYILNSQDVLIPAFLATYGAKPASEVPLTAFPKIPLPNWRIDYGGLTKIPAIGEKFTSINLTHSYVSTYSVGNFISGLEYDPGEVQLDRSRDLFPRILDDTGKLKPVYQLNMVSIREQFSPLIGINIRTKSKVTFKIDYNRDRNLALNINNSSITESRGWDLTFGVGYQKSGVKLPFRIQGRQVVLKNELTTRCDISFRDQVTVQRMITAESEITQGAQDIQIRPNINYVFNQRLNIQMYFDRNITTPRTSNSFKRTSTRFGIQVRFNLT